MSQPRLTHHWHSQGHGTPGLPAAGMMAHSRPDIAFPIILVAIITQGAALGMAAALRPWLSAFLNLLEVACGGMDVANLIITAIAYRAKMISTTVSGHAFITVTDSDSDCCAGCTTLPVSTQSVHCSDCTAPFAAVYPTLDGV
jgi:hypothetical protein